MEDVNPDAKDNRALLSQLTKDLKYLKAEGFPVWSEIESLRTAKSEMEKGEDLQARANLHIAQRLVEKKLKIQADIVLAESALERLSTKFRNLDHPQKLLSKAKGERALGKIDTAEKLARQVIRLTKDIVEQYPLASEKLEQLATDIGDLRLAGVPLDTELLGYVQAEQSLEEANIKSAISQIESINSSIEDVKLTLARIADIETKIDHSPIPKEFLNAPLETIHGARMFLTTGKYSDAKKQCDVCITSLRESEEFYQKNSKLIARVEDYLKPLFDHDATLDDEKLAYEAMMASINDGDFVSAFTHLQEVGTSIKRRETDRDVTERALADARAQLESYGRLQLDLTDAMVCLGKASDAFNIRDYSGTNKLIGEALQYSLAVLSKASPSLEIVFIGELQPKIWNKAIMRISNIGHCDLDDLRFEIEGACEVQRIRRIDHIDYGETRDVHVAVFSERGGSVPIDIRIDMVRAHDTKEFTTEISTWVEIAPEAVPPRQQVERYAPSFSADRTPDISTKSERGSLVEGEGHIVSRDENLGNNDGSSSRSASNGRGIFLQVNILTYCGACGGVITKGTQAFACECGTAMHEGCAGRLNICPSCKRSIEIR